MKICEIESVKKSIFEEIAKMDEQLNNLNTKLVIEESQCVKITKSQVKFFLTQIKNGYISDNRYKKDINNTLVNKVFLYDDSILIIFSGSDRTYEGKLLNIKDLEEWLMVQDALSL